MFLEHWERGWGPLMLEGEFENAVLSSAYLYEDGRILIHGEEAGRKESLVYLADVDIAAPDARRLLENLVDFLMSGGCYHKHEPKN